MLAQSNFLCKLKFVTGSGIIKAIKDGKLVTNDIKNLL